MREVIFSYQDQSIPVIDEAQMREVDRIAVEEFGLGILQMMENAGRNLALSAMQAIAKYPNPTITILAGVGGNGGGGICCARHLHNRGFKVNLILTKPAEAYRGPAAAQLNILQNAGLIPSQPAEAEGLIKNADVVIDALIGYSLKGAPREPIKSLIQTTNQFAKQVIALDIPSGIDSTTGATPGEYIQANQTITLALPKTGLKNPACGAISLADIGIPPAVYHQIGIPVEYIFGDHYLLPLEKQTDAT